MPGPRRSLRTSPATAACADASRLMIAQRTTELREPGRGRGGRQAARARYRACLERLSRGKHERAWDQVGDLRAALETTRDQRIASAWRVTLRRPRVSVH